VVAPPKPPAQAPLPLRVAAALGVLFVAIVLGALVGAGLGITEQPTPPRLAPAGAPRVALPAPAERRLPRLGPPSRVRTVVTASTPAPAPSLAAPLLEGEVLDLAPGSGETWVTARAPGGVTLEAPVEGARFRLELPAAGPWELRAVREGASSPWTVIEDPRAMLRLVLEAHTVLRGRVLGPTGPLAGAQVEAWREAGPPSTSVSDDRGGFALELPPGAGLRVLARAPGLAPASVRYAPSEQPPSELTLVLQTLVPVVGGPFLGADGTPLPGPLACDPLDPDRHDHAVERDPLVVELDDAGRPELLGLPDGRWVVSLHEPAPDELRAWVREVDASEDPVTLELPQAPRGRLSGRANAPRGSEVEVELRPHPADGERFGFLATRFANADGGFTFGAVPHGTYRVQASWRNGRSRPALVEVGASGRAWVELIPE